MRRLRNVKIVATLGPSSSDYTTIRALFEAGADVFRLNMSHGTHEEQQARYDILRQVEADTGRPVAVLADLSSWKIETADLTELDVAAIQAGDTVRLTVDALPEVELTGVVERISDVGENKKGDISYTVVIRPDQNDSRLKWNMTVAATFAGK